jgi:hypothetical protein
MSTKPTTMITPSTEKEEWHNFLIPDRTLRPEGFHLCSESYDLSMQASQDQHSNIVQLLSRIRNETESSKNNPASVLVTDEKKEHDKAKQQQQQGVPEHPTHEFLQVDRSLRPEGFHLVDERPWNGQRQISH